MSGVTPGLRDLLGRLQAYVVDWKFSFVPTEHENYEVGIDRERAADLEVANVISSERLGYPKDPVYVEGEKVEVFPGFFGPKRQVDEDGKDVWAPRHAVLLDIDYPAHLIESSTPGHYHLYLDVPSGVPHEIYMRLLALLAEAKVIEQGFADVSIARGHSDLRLPWVTKDDQVLHPDDGIDTQPPPDEPSEHSLDPFPFDSHA